jgi:hypothetical protein
MSKTNQYEKDTINSFMEYLRERDFQIVKTINSKSYSRTDYKGDGERTIINFHLEMKKVSNKDMDRELTLFCLENFEI